MPDGTRHGAHGREVHLDLHDGEGLPKLHAGMERIGIEAFGVGFAIAAPKEVMPRVRGILPPGWKEKEPAEEDEHFTLQREVNDVYRVLYSTLGVSGSSDLRIALEVLDSRLRMYIARLAPEHVFVHAGVVGHVGRTIVIPGTSFSGKTTLVAELVRAGATYFSDEYAVLDQAGVVHPYPKPLSIRPNPGEFAQVDHPVETIGGTAGVEPLPVGLVVAAPYSPGASWNPRRLTSGEAVLALLEHTIPAQERPEEAMSTLTKAVNGAIVLQGERGEAAAIAPELLAELREQPASN